MKNHNRISKHGISEVVAGLMRHLYYDQGVSREKIAERCELPMRVVDSILDGKSWTKYRVNNK